MKHVNWIDKLKCKNTPHVSILFVHCFLQEYQMNGQLFLIWWCTFQLDYVLCIHTYLPYDPTGTDVLCLISVVFGSAMGFIWSGGSLQEIFYFLCASEKARYTIHFPRLNVKCKIFSFLFSRSAHLETVSCPSLPSYQWVPWRSPPFPEFLVLFPSDWLKEMGCSKCSTQPYKPETPRHRGVAINQWARGV